MSVLPLRTDHQELGAEAQPPSARSAGHQRPAAARQTPACGPFPPVAAERGSCPRQQGRGLTAAEVLLSPSYLVSRAGGGPRATSWPFPPLSTRIHPVQTHRPALPHGTRTRGPCPWSCDHPTPPRVQQMFYWLCKCASPCGAPPGSPVSTPLPPDSQPLTLLPRAQRRSQSTFPRWHFSCAHLCHGDTRPEKLPAVAPCASGRAVLGHRQSRTRWPPSPGFPRLQQPSRAAGHRQVMATPLTIQLGKVRN